MLTLTTNVGPLRGRAKWFADRPALVDSLRLVSYMQSLYSRRCLGFVRIPFRTMIVDLALSEDDLLTMMSKNVQYKVRRARRDGVVCRFDEPVGRFVEFHRQVVDAAGRKRAPDAVIESATSNCAVASAAHADRVVAMHCYLLDEERRRVRLWYSASRYRCEESSEARNLIGRANRLLHYEAMLHFKRSYRTYDFGGYAADGSDQKKMNINSFKDGFGGDVIQESHYYSYPLYFGLLAGKLLGRRAP